MKITKFLMGIAVALILVACSGEPRIDASSMEAFEASMDEVTESLTPEQEARFQVAMMNLLMTTGISMYGGENEEEVLRQLRSNLHRKTADQVIRQYGE